MALVTDVNVDTAGPRVPRSLSTGSLVAGTLGLGISILGSAFVLVGFAIGRTTPPLSCVQRIGVNSRGVDATCRIVQGLKSGTETTLLGTGIFLGVVAIAVGFSTYRLMDTRITRRRAFAAGVLGIQSVTLAGILLWFRSGQLDLFSYQFLNWTVLGGQFGAFLDGAKNTVILAVVGEAGGLVIGLTLSLLTLSEFRVVRAPARVYINFFRGTPLIWQLSVFYFGLDLGLRLSLSTFATAMLVFCLYIGAYSAEVFRAGIQSIERGQLDAARGLGFSQLQAMRFAIVPQAFRKVIPPLLNEFVGLIKDTSLIIVLGLTLSQRDLFSTAADGYATSFNATFYVAAAAGYLIITLPLIGTVNALERRLRSGLLSVGS